MGKHWKASYFSNSTNIMLIVLRKMYTSTKIESRKEGATMIQTKRWRLTNNEMTDEQAIQAAASLIKEGATVAFPTETVYGLGADATNATAVAKIFIAKGRPQDNPLIAHVATTNQLRKLVSDLPTYAEKLITAFTPGPITFVLPSNGTCATNVTAGLDTVAIRIPNHPVAQKLLQACNVPIAAPSANTSGKPSPTLADHVAEDLLGRIAGIIDGGQTGVGVESTVVDCTQATGPIILRPGGITKEQLEQVVGTVIVDPALADKDEKPISPGVKYKHYAPEVRLLLVEGNSKNIQAIIDQEQGKSLRVGVLASTETATHLQADKIIPLGKNLNEVAANLYSALRSFKKAETDVIVCEIFPETDIGQAIMNRLKKAANEVIKA
jgi:L-threonylcarbamoyladenylate synthase